MELKLEDFEKERLEKMSKEELITLVCELGNFLLRVRKKTDKIKISGKVKMTMTDIETGEVEISEYKNLIPTCGREAIARRLINEGLKASESIITYGAVGTNTSAPALVDTTLGTELFRKTIASTSRTSNELHINTFLTTAEGNGNLREFGLFGEDANGTANSGTLFEKVSINRTKTSAKTLLIESVLTIE